MTDTAEWPDPETAAVDRALKLQAGSVLARAVEQLRIQVAALTDAGEHSGSCDEQAQCTRCWERERIDEAERLTIELDHARAAVQSVARVRATYGDGRDADGHGRLVNILQVLDLLDPAGMWSYSTAALPLPHAWTEEPHA